MKPLLLALVLSGAFISCKQYKTEHVERAFYYWKSNGYQFTQMEDSVVKKAGIHKFYVKYFEVEKNPVMGLVPVAKTNFRFWNRDSTQIIPTVYLRNEVFKDVRHGELDTLADNVNFLVRKYSGEGRDYGFKVPLTEYQMDCDWTPGTKDNYFYFLRKLKAVSGLQISCTLRLYPYKYPAQMGVPPVDKVTLMCYNLVNPLENKEKNSILDIDELSAYLNVNQKYPLHLDIALPVYSWIQVYRNNHFVKVIPGNADDFGRVLKPIQKKLWYAVTTDSVADGFYLKAGDKIKVEEITEKQLQRAIRIIKQNVELDSDITVALFHLDNQQLKHYSNAEISGLYTAFTQ
ncbi:hypothetical protein [Flavobacterium sp.]|uniref:hypothetical protein n=1 Tax=Flavobacterium sp. TaxID=239 RepID=UPI002621B1A3|nr:hypothetical protein [Flavobacterium sp.]